MENKNILTIPLWLLLDADEIDNVLLDTSLAKNMREYSLEKRKYLYTVLETLDDNFDFTEVISNMPTTKKISFSNDEIYGYLMSFKFFMENEEYILLSS